VLSNATAPSLSATLLALMTVSFSVPAGTPAGTYALTFNQNDPTSDFTADWYNNVSNSDPGTFSPGAVVNGSIVVTTPEPSSVLMLLVGAVGLIGIGVRRARKA
jgi:hypothetical protein